MKKLILSELIFIFLATTFIVDSPTPGWFQQTLPVNKTVNDIFFTDSLNGWVVTFGNTNNNDTGYILRTMNGGTNWQIQFNQPRNLTSLFFTNSNTGYVGGGSGSGTRNMYKTVDGGNSWIQIIGTFGVGVLVDDIYFINNDTGWFCDKNILNGGVFKTTDGGVNWQQQMGASYLIKKLFFLNKDTGWAGSNDNKLYRTINGGTNWNLQYNSNVPIGSIFFWNQLKGWINGGTGNGVLYSTDGGFTWNNAQGTLAGYDIRFINDSIGYSGSVPNIAKTIDGGKNWGYQITPANTYLSVSTLDLDTLRGWAGTYNFIRTTDGGGQIIIGIKKIGKDVPKDYKLYQNYPNPFNPVTKIKYLIKSNVKREMSNIKVEVHDISGKKITDIVNQNQSAGEYEVDFEGSAYSSGIYFYSLIVDGQLIETKKMILAK